jgi:cytoskeletal protein RodZ
MPVSGESRLKTLGETLRAAREARGQSIDRLAKTLRIRKRYIEAVEEDRFTDLPPRPYAEIFISAYAKGVGVSAREALDRYFAETGEAPPKNTKLWDVGDEMAPAEGKDSHALAWIAAVIVVLVLAAVVLLSRG